MKTATSLFILSLGALFARALPTTSSIISRDDPAADDIVVLNFALFLEHIEDAFYTEGLQQFDAEAFESAGFEPFVRNRYLQLADHERTHVQFLTEALGDKAVKPCEYTFPFTDVTSFVAVSRALEGTGTSAYTGAAQLIDNANFLTVAASILATEGRHRSWIAAAVQEHSGWSGAFDVPLSPNSVFSIASAFVVPDSCPETIQALPVKTLPPLSMPDARPGASVTIDLPESILQLSDTLFIVFLTGLDKVFVEINDGEVIVPQGLLGTVYAVVSTSGTVADDDSVVSGAAMFEFDFDSEGKLEDD